MVNASVNMYADFIEEENNSATLLSFHGFSPYMICVELTLH